jgi:hypothetical protein
MARLEGGRPLGTIPQTPLANLGGHDVVYSTGLTTDHFTLQGTVVVC